MFDGTPEQGDNKDNGADGNRPHYISQRIGENDGTTVRKTPVYGVIWLIVPILSILSLSTSLYWIFPLKYAE